MKTKEALVVSITEDYQDFQQLLESLESLVSHIIVDNQLCLQEDTDFPTSIRLRQCESIASLSNTLQETIKEIDNL